LLVFRGNLRHGNATCSHYVRLENNIAFGSRLADSETGDFTKMTAFVSP